MKRLLAILFLLLTLYCVVKLNPKAFDGFVPAVRQAASHASASMSGSHADLRAYAREQAAAAGIPADWFVNQIEVESGFNPDARGGSGEVGVAQFMPGTAAGLGVNPYDAHDALRGAAQMMGRYYRQYGDYAKALAGYNCGSGCLQHAVAVGGGSWGCYVPGITRSYIWKVMSEQVC